MKDTEVSRFLLNLLHFAFEAHELEFPEIYNEIYSHINYAEDTHLTPALREGIIDNIENMTIVSRRTEPEAIGDYFLRQLMENYSEENLLDFISFKARNCLYSNLDPATLVDELELMMNVFDDAIVSHKFNSDSWADLETAAKHSTIIAKERLAAHARRMAFGKLFPNLSTSSCSSLDAADEPEWKKTKIASTSTSSSEGMVDARHPSLSEFEKLELSDAEGDKTSKIEESVFLEAKVSKTKSKESEDIDKDLEKVTELKQRTEVESTDITKSSLSKQIKSVLPDETSNPEDVFEKSEKNVEEKVIESCEIKTEVEAVSGASVEAKLESIATETKSKETEISDSGKCSDDSELAFEPSEPSNRSEKSESTVKESAEISDEKLESMKDKGEATVCNLDEGKEVEAEKDAQPTGVSKIQEN